MYNSSLKFIHLESWIHLHFLHEYVCIVSNRKNSTNLEHISRDSLGLKSEKTFHNLPWFIHGTNISCIIAMLAWRLSLSVTSPKLNQPCDFPSNLQMCFFPSITEIKYRNNFLVYNKFKVSVYVHFFTCRLISSDIIFDADWWVPINKHFFKF